MTDTAPLRLRGLWLRLGVSAVLAIAFAAALAPYLDAIPDDLGVPAWVVPAYVASLLPYHWLRASRWAFLVRPLGPVPLGRITLVGLAGYMWIALLPFRLGELARPLFLAERSSIPVRQALGTVAIERVVDGLVICGTFFGAVALLGSPEGIEPLYAATVGVVGVFAIALVVLAAMAVRPATAGRFADAVVARVSPKLARSLGELVRGIAEGLAALPSPRPLFGFVLASLAYWAVNAAGMWLLAVGCGLELSALQSVVLLTVMNIALLVPGGPAQFGVFQTGVALGLALFVDADTVRNEGSVFAFYLYVCQLGTITVLGLLAQRSLRLDWRALLRPGRGGRRETKVNCEP